MSDRVSPSAVGVGVEAEAEAAASSPVNGMAAIGRAGAKDYALLLKPRVMSLVVFTGLAGLLLAPGSVNPWLGAVAVFLIAVGAGASGAINMWYDRDIDRHMSRTRDRPIPAGRVRPDVALAVGVVLSGLSVGAMALVVNGLAAVLLAVTIGYYVFIYTIWLKRRTPLNIVIGGASGAFPPMIGWAAATGALDWGAVALFAIIFVWTPPHFWALALFRCGDYANAGVPMLPVVSGMAETRRQILVYSVLMLPTSLLPVAVGLSGAIYGIVALMLGVILIHRAILVRRDEGATAARRLFFFSILYLFLLFVSLLGDRLLFLPLW